jgi:hypothetical protein
MIIMRINTALAALLVFTASIVNVPMSAQAETRAQLRLLVVDQANVPLPGAAVTVYTLDGNPGVTVVADAKGVARFAGLGGDLVQIVAKADGFEAYIDKTTLQGQPKMLTVRLEKTGARITSAATSDANRS